MLDKNHLAEIISLYKQDFESFVWEKENYKWEAIKQFQNNWNIDAEDFFEMLHQSLSKTYNLLDSSSRFPRRMIELFTRKSPEKLRAMFRALYDESKGIYERIEIFKNKSSDLLEKYGDGALQHYQDENTRKRCWRITRSRMALPISGTIRMTDIQAAILKDRHGNSSWKMLTKG